MLLAERGSSNRAGNRHAHNPREAWIVGGRVEPKTVRPAPGGEPGTFF